MIVDAFNLIDTIFTMSSMSGANGTITMLTTVQAFQKEYNTAYSYCDFDALMQQLSMIGSGLITPKKENGTATQETVKVMFDENNNLVEMVANSTTTTPKVQTPRVQSNHDLSSLQQTNGFSFIGIGRMFSRISGVFWESWIPIY